MGRPQAMLSHYNRSLLEEKEYQSWDEGREVPADENPYVWMSYRLGTLTLVERGRSCPEFVGLINVDVFVCRECGKPSAAEIYGNLYCQFHLQELTLAWEAARKQCGLD